MSFRGDEQSHSNRRPERQRVTFAEDFKRFFVRGLAALLPTLITVAIIWYILNFLWNSVGWYLIQVIKQVWLGLVNAGLVQPTSAGHIGRVWGEEQLHTRVVGVLLAIVLIYILGLLVGNLIGRTFWKILENAVMKIPIVRAIYPAVKQVTDFLLSDRTQQFRASRVVAIQPHERGIWSIGLVTGQGPGAMNEATGQEMVMVFLPNSPAAFSGYVVVVPRNEVVELPLTVEEAMRLFVSGGVIVPGSQIEVGGRRIALQSPRPPRGPMQQAEGSGEESARAQSQESASRSPNAPAA
ncbi:MAG TPA: DUF502 domain-containing protein [Tepidisphaeraceae bacterium]|nr:DUF502 domain-containing protein [Tepidisphaeraceae bacterium]